MGRALESLGGKVNRSERSVVVQRDGELWCDRQAIEEMLYAPTFMTYRGREMGSGPRVSKRKVWRPSTWHPTEKMQLTLRRWAADPPEVVTLAEQKLTGWPRLEKGLAPLELALDEKVWPRMLVIELLAWQMYTWATEGTALARQARWQEFFCQEVARKGWLIAAQRDETKVRKGEWTLEKYLAEYGRRADIDLELTCPRWYEQPEKVAARIAKGQEQPAREEVSVEELKVKDKVRRQMMAAIELEWIRQRARRQLLEYLDALRGYVAQVSS